MNIIYTAGLLILAQILIWFSTNSQLVEGWSKTSAIYICAGLALPISFITFYATKVGFDALGSLWSLRLLAFGMSYIAFPALTWFFLKESPFSVKTMSCIGLSVIIIAIQVTVPDT